MEYLNKFTDGNAAFFIAAGLFSGLAGVAALLRSNDPVGWKRIVGALLNSGLLGLAVGLVWFSQFRENAYALLGICILLGLGGNLAVEYVLNAMKKGGFIINLNSGKLDTKPSDEEKK